jgi:signal transduction histidine kinase
VEVRVEGRLPEQVEIAPYFVVAEALTNTAEHTHATAVTVVLAVDEDAVCGSG